MRLSLLLAAIINVMLFLMTAPANSETYAIASSVPFADKSGVTPEQQVECALDTRLPRYIAAAADPDMEILISPEPVDKVEGKALKLEIVHVYDGGEKLFSDPSAVAVRGELKKGGTVIGSFVAFRWTKKTVKFDGFTGACARLGRSLEVLSQDIVIWLQNPTMKARLGEA